MVSLELALADERGRLQEETRRSWHKGRQSLLAAAHREWTAAQEVVTRAEVKRAKREWEEGRKEEVKVGLCVRCAGGRECLCVMGSCLYVLTFDLPGCSGGGVVPGQAAL